jgi:hypothetical protein
VRPTRCRAVSRSGTFARLPAGSGECGHVRSGAGPDERDAPTMTTIAMGLTVPVLRSSPDRDTAQSEAVA